MFATLLALGLTLSAVHCDEFSAEVRLHSSWDQIYTKNNCDLLIPRSLGPWNHGSFRNCRAQSSIEKEGGPSMVYTITVNKKNFKNFPTNATIDEKYALINQQLNLDAQSCDTVTGPNWEMTLGSFPTSYPMEIHLYMTAPDQDVNCTTVISDIRKTSPLLRPIDCKHQAAKSEIAQSYPHRFEVNMQMPDTNDLPVTEVILLHLLWIQSTLEFERSNCTQRGFPVYDPESEVWNFLIWSNENGTSTINCARIRDHTPCLPKSCELMLFPAYKGSHLLLVQFEASICGQLDASADDKEAASLFNTFWNGLHTSCPFNPYKITRDSFHQEAAEVYYYALVTGPSHVNECQKAKDYKKYGAHICKEIQNLAITSAANNQRTFCMLQKGLIYLLDIPWYINEHSKFVHFLNTGSSKCKFNGYVHLNEIEINRVLRGHTSSSRFP